MIFGKWLPVQEASNFTIGTITMMSLKQAAEISGKTKPTVLKAIKSGRLSAVKNDLGQWKIDPAELERVYPPVSVISSKGGEILQHEPASELMGLRAEVRVLGEQLEREKETVNDLRRRLDVEGEERRKLTMILTDQRGGFWRRVLGG